MLLAEIGVVIPAAGQGKRMGVGYNKQFLPLGGEPILAHTIRVFEAANRVSAIVLVGAKADISILEELVLEYKFAKVVAIIHGGAERQDSVRAGVQALPPAIRRVVVHDGARPLLTLEGFRSFLREAEGLTAAVMGIPLKDTVKKVDAAGRVLETPLRDSLRAIQTPQIFEREILEKAHCQAVSAGYYSSDDAGLLEWLGYPVQVLEGSWENIKVTTPEDLWLAEQILKKRGARLEV